VLADYISLCSEKNIHLISDEIYALSHYQNDYARKEVPFTSLLAMPADSRAKNRIHVL
jgi:1-aminocyclopropane-1-carboxylate synthase